MRPSTCLVERDPSIKVLAGLPVGMRALRDRVSDTWEWQEIEKEKSPPNRDVNTLALDWRKAPAAARKEIFC